MWLLWRKEKRGIVTRFEEREAHSGGNLMQPRPNGNARIDWMVKGLLSLAET